MSGLRASISISNYGIVPKTISYTKKAFFPHIIKDDKPIIKRFKSIEDLKAIKAYLKISY